MSKPTQTELYAHLRMFFCVGCKERGDDEVGCEDCPVAEIPLDPPEKEEVKQ